jgi:hypothetical protein
MSVIGYKVTESPGSLPTQWAIDVHEQHSVIIAKSNGTTNFDQVLGGTPLGRITASGKYRPCLKAPLAGAIAGANSGDVGAGNAPLIFDADVIDIISKAGVKGAVTMADLDGVGASGESIDLEGLALDGIPHRVTLVDPGGASQAFSVDSDYDDATGIRTITISLETDGGSLSLTTIREIIDAINDEGGDAVRASLAAGATDTTVVVVGSAGNYDLAGGAAPGGALATGRNVSNVNKATGTFDFDGAAVTAAAGDVVQASDGSENAKGALYDSIQTLGQEVASDGTPQHLDQGETLVTRAHAYEEEMIGLNAEIKADLGAKFTYRYE